MALHSWPSNDIMDALQIVSASFRLQRLRQFSRGADGTLYRAELAPSIWIGDFTSGQMEHAAAEAVKALANSMEDQLASFYAWNPAVPYPQADLKGLLLGVATPIIASIDADNKRVTISGMPAGYVLTRGDYLVVTRAVDGNRQLLQVVDATVTADGSGDMALFEVTPHIRTGMASGDAITLYKPGCQMVMAPDSANKLETADGEFSVVTFSAVEAP